MAIPERAWWKAGKASAKHTDKVGVVFEACEHRAGLQIVQENEAVPRAREDAGGPHKCSCGDGGGMSRQDGQGLCHCEGGTSVLCSAAKGARRGAVRVGLGRPKVRAPVASACTTVSSSSTPVVRGARRAASGKAHTCAVSSPEAVQTRIWPDAFNTMSIPLTDPLCPGPTPGRVLLALLETARRQRWQGRLQGGWRTGVHHERFSCGGVKDARGSVCRGGCNLGDGQGRQASKPAQAPLAERKDGRGSTPAPTRFTCALSFTRQATSQTPSV